MLLVYGNTVCPQDWRIDEKIPVGYCRVYYVLGGEVRYTDSQHQADLVPGRLYIFPSATPYRMRQNVANPLRCTFIHIDIFPSLVTELVECQLDGNPTLLHMLMALTSAIDDADKVMIDALADVFEQYTITHHLIAPPVHSLTKIFMYIADHIDQDLTVGQLSAIAGYNEQYFIRFFRRNVGLTPYQYIISNRLKVARDLLRKRETVARTAEMTGYGDIKSFGRAFKQSYGVTPSAFRGSYTVLP